MGDAWYVRVQDATGIDPPRSNLYYQNYNVITDVQNHAGTVINLFDYWIDARDAADNVEDTDDRLSSGINAGHALKFRKSNTAGLLNQWTKNAGVRQGIVANLLNNGYPVLSGAGVWVLQRRISPASISMSPSPTCLTRL